MHVSLCSYCTIRILISKTLTGTYEGGYTCVLLLIAKYVYIVRQEYNVNVVKT